MVELQCEPGQATPVPSASTPHRLMGGERGDGIASDTQVLRRHFGSERPTKAKQRVDYPHVILLGQNSPFQTHL